MKFDIQMGHRNGLRSLPKERAESHRTEKRMSLPNQSVFLYQRNYPLQIRSSNFPVKFSQAPALAKEKTPR